MSRTAHPGDGGGMTDPRLRRFLTGRCTSGREEKITLRRIGGRGSWFFLLLAVVRAVYPGHRFPLAVLEEK